MVDELILGDAYKLIKLIPDKSVDLVYVDVPYEIHTHGYGRIADYKGLHKLSQDLTRENLNEGFDYSILDDFVRVCKKVYIYIWCSLKQVYPIMKYMLEKYELNYQILSWCKINPLPFGNKQFLDDVEYCLVFYESGVDVNIGVDNKHKWFASPLNVKDKELYDHPTIKPLEYVSKHILNSSKEGDIVLDAFAGSGTTLVACKELNRHYIGFEIDEHYYQIAKDRLNNITQKEKKEIEQGKVQQETLW